jgi:hypothetical protein
MLRSTSVVMTTSGSLAVDRVVAREQPHLRGAVPSHEVAELLVGQRFERRGVEALPAERQRSLDRVLGDHGLARSRGRRDQHRAPRGERVDRVELEPVERERVAAREAPRVGHGPSLRAMPDETGDA